MNIIKGTGKGRARVTSGRIEITKKEKEEAMELLSNHCFRLAEMKLAKLWDISENDAYRVLSAVLNNYKKLVIVD